MKKLGLVGKLVVAIILLILAIMFGLTSMPVSSWWWFAVMVFVLGAVFALLLDLVDLKLDTKLSGGQRVLNFVLNAVLVGVLIVLATTLTMLIF